jgi:UDP-N-acetylmuramate: L-alanyl-gamma-D-glutamyl-meso-diaminopimelate ligase
MAMVVYDPGNVQRKGLPDISLDALKKAFNRSDLKVYTNMQAVTADLEAVNWKNKNLLLMSSGNFMGTDINALANKLIG